MSLKIISADERLATQTGVKMVIFGGVGLGKTSAIKTLEEPTLCLDLEAGLLSIQAWRGDVISIRTWEEARDLACFIGGPNPALRPEQAFSRRHFDFVCSKYGDPKIMDKYACIFVDSLTVASRLCLQWCKSQPEASTERTGKLDLRAAYGLLAHEMLAWLSQFQYIPNKDIILVGILEQKLDDFNKTLWVPQLEGSKIAQELPGILDEVISLVALPQENGPPQRVFVCQTLNPWSYPAKDRSGKLDMIEEAHLGNLLKKIKSARHTHPTSTAERVLAPCSPQPKND